MKNIAVIGCGGQGTWHCKQIMNSNVVALAGTFDIDSKRMLAAKELGINLYDSFEAVLADEKVDAVVIAVPNDDHKELVIKALNAGKNVICEKPVEMSVKALDEMIEAANNSGKLFTVHQNRRFDVDYLAIHGIVKSGEIGDVIRIESRIHGSRGIPSDWRCTKAKGGGMILDWGVHLIDQLLQIFKEKIVSINCVTTNITKTEVDDGFRLDMIFENGKSAYVEVGTYNFIAMPRFYMQCEKGTLYLADWQKPAHVAKLTRWIEKDVKPVQNAAGITKTMAPRDHLTLDEYDVERPTADVHEFYRNFCDAIDGKCEQLIKNEEVRRVLLVMMNAFLSAEKNQTVAVEI